MSRKRLNLGVETVYRVKVVSDTGCGVTTYHCLTEARQAFMTLVNDQLGNVYLVDGWTGRAIREYHINSTQQR